MVKSMALGEETDRNGEKGIEKKIEGKSGMCSAVCCVVLQVSLSRIVSPTWGYRR
jgi:hypothetical protein